MMNKTIYVILLATIFFACKPKEHGAFTVSGHIANANNAHITLEELPFGEEKTKVIDTATLKNGQFILRGMAKDEGLYLLSLQNGPQILLVNDAKSIRVQMDVNNYKKYTTEGSKASTQLHELFMNYETQFAKLKTAFNNLDSAQIKKQNDSIQTVLRLQKDEELKKLNSLLNSFVENSASAAASLQAVAMAQRTMPVEDFQALVAKAAVKFKENESLQKYKKMVDANGHPLLNKPAPDFALPTPNGDTVKLSSFKGKYVLIDFWASWCKPCRAENPNVVAAYQKFNDKNFTVLGVSLDAAKKDWENAIANDKLTWTHVSDLLQWESPLVKLYSFEGIPFNVLLDPSGKVIAYNLRGDALEKKLSEVLK